MFPKLTYKQSEYWTLQSGSLGTHLSIAVAVQQHPPTGKSTSVSVSKHNTIMETTGV